jgi:NADH-quinone oxidoreductase subunit H
MTGMQVGWTLIKILVMVGFLFNTGAVLTWLDRRQSAMIQDRIGPNRAVIKIFGIELRLGGLLHTAADGIKFFFKEDFIPPNADKVLFGLAPILAMMPVLALVAVIPFGDTVFIQALWNHGRDGALLWPPVSRIGAPITGVAVYTGIDKGWFSPVELMVAPLNVGILYVFALAGQGIVGAAIAGWSSDNKFSLMGALRAASQMVSYEVTMGLSLVGAMMLYGTVRLDDMVRWQGENAWGIFVQPVAFILFFVAAVAESKRIPFDLPEAESELVSGYFTEYSGMKFGMFYFAEYMEICTSSMLLVTIFLGGWQLPFLHRDGISIDFGYAHVWSMLMPHIWVTVFQVATFFGKTLMVCWLQAFVRWSLPRFRYDQLMKLGWRVLLPCSLANIMLTGVGVLATDHFSAAAKGGLKVAADVTQGVVFAAIVAFVVALVAGFIRPQAHARWIAGTSARFAQAKGGTKATPMQA